MDKSPAIQSIPSLIPPRDRPRRKNSAPLPLPKVDKKAAIKLKTEHGLSYAQIAAMQGVCKQAVQQAIHKDIEEFIANQEVTKSYKENRADILAGLQVRTLANLDDCRLKRASALQLVTATGILYDKERLERGLSSSNVSIQVGLSNTLQASIDALVRRVPDVVDVVGVGECAIVAQRETDNEVPLSD